MKTEAIDLSAMRTILDLLDDRPGITAIDLLTNPADKLAARRNAAKRILRAAQRIPELRQSATVALLINFPRGCNGAGSYGEFDGHGGNLAGWTGIEFDWRAVDASAEREGEALAQLAEWTDRPLPVSNIIHAQRVAACAEAIGAPAQPRTPYARHAALVAWDGIIARSNGDPDAPPRRDYRIKTDADANRRTVRRSMLDIDRLIGHATKTGRADIVALLAPAREQLASALAG